MTDAPTGSRAPSSVPCIHCGAEHPASYSHCPQTGNALGSGPALVGRVVADRYRITGLLGEGGMGAVYLAEHMLIGRPVALKRLHPELATEDRAVVRFQREARAAAAIGHDHIVDILDLGFAEDGAPFLVMERLEGESLASALQSAGSLGTERTCFIVGQALDALRAVHRKNIVHRDLKPDNVFLTRRAGYADFVKVLDFGVSKMRREDDEGLELTRTGVMLGTPYYMSPEQARGMRTLDHRVDLWATGVMLYQALTGHLPFQGDNYHALLQAILTTEPPRVDALAPATPKELADVVHRTIARDPEERYADASEMLQALVPFGAIDPENTPMVTTPASSHASATAPTTPMNEANRTTTPRTPDAPPATMPSWGHDTGTRRRDATPGRRTPREAADVKGALVLGALDHIRHQHGATAVDEIVAALPESASSTIQGVLLPLTWLPLSHYARLLEVADRSLGRGDGKLAETIGVTTAEHELGTTHRLFVQTATPLRAVERLPRLWSSYHGGGRLEVSAEQDRWIVEVHDLVPDERTHAMAMAGFYRRLLEMTGARDVQAVVRSCRGDGDELTVTELSWR